MTKRFRWLSLVLVAALGLGGPLAPWAALAQTAQVGGATQPVGGTSEQRWAVSGLSEEAKEPTDAHRVGAVAVNVFHVPGKAIVCGLGTVASTLLLLLTFGSGYRAAVSAFSEGCGGTWVVTPEHLSGKIPPTPDL